MSENFWMLDALRRALDKHKTREVHLLHAPKGHGARTALHVCLSGFDCCKPGLHSDGHPFDLEITKGKLLRDRFHDTLADVDCKTGNLIVRIHVRERLGVTAISNLDGLCALDGLKAAAGCDLRMRCRCGQKNKAEKRCYSDHVSPRGWYLRPLSLHLATAHPATQSTPNGAAAVTSDLHLDAAGAADAAGQARGRP